MPKSPSLNLEKQQESMMRTIHLQSKSSCGSTTMEEEEEDNCENSSSICYYPGCKKDANCNCEICLASFNATRDLMPMSTHKSSITKFSASKPNFLESTPISFDASYLSTPSSSTFRVMLSTPAIKSSARSVLNKKMEKQEEEEHQQRCFSGLSFLSFLLGLGFLLLACVIFTKVLSGIFQPALSADLVKSVGEKCWQMQDLNGKLSFLQKELTSVVIGKVSNCCYSDSGWKINQDGVLLNSRCTLYKSAIEEVTIWGWPLQTAGLLTTEFSSRTFTIISGRVTEWNSGQVGYSIRKVNTSWVQSDWGASVVQLDPNTWVLEYQRSSIFYGTRLHSAAVEFLRIRVARIVGRVKRSLWLLVAFEDSLHNGFTANNGIKIPT